MAFYTIRLILVALTLSLVAAISGVRAEEEGRVMQYEFPTPAEGADFGQLELVRYIEKERLRADDIPDRLFDRLDLLEMSNILRTRILGGELAKLDAELEDIDLVGAVNTAATDVALAALLEAKSISEGELLRGLRDTFEPFYANEAAAYWVQQGYSERYLLARLKREDESDRRYQKIKDYVDNDAGRPARIWRDQARELNLTEQMELYLGLAGRPDQTEIEKVFEKDRKTLTPSLMRVLRFGDPELAALALTAAGVRPQSFFDVIEDFYDQRERDGQGAQSAGDLIVRLGTREDAHTDWLRKRGKDVSGVYEGRLSGAPVFPVLGKLEGEGDPKALEDFGITQSIAGYFSQQPNAKIVLYANNSVRALVNGVRYEGALDRAAGTLNLEAIYGGGSDIRLDKVAFHGKGLLMELSIADTKPEKARVLLRRTRAY
ncbi:MAG: hypothetical protein L6Q71_04055 [Planctomycetes bacterium]|nr:hypothetical protein [Planctomycetota bacterium]NUQ35622.1 hypothetical protein [Planctomycetaceae bacterium]